MNLLFLTMTRFGDGTGRGIYTDLMRKFREQGHEVYVIYPVERGAASPPTPKPLSPLSPLGRGLRNLTSNPELLASGENYKGGWKPVKGGFLLEYDHMHILGVKTLKVQKTNVIEKGLGQVLIEPLFTRALKKYFARVKFDIITYSTPPITLVGAIKWAKRHNPQAMTYLQLKDIFPQNAVDLDMMPCQLRVERLEVRELVRFPIRFAKYLLYNSFRRKEKQLYKVSDWIGCMSPANVKYVIDNNPEVDKSKVEICPNSFSLESEPLFPLSPLGRGPRNLTPDSEPFARDGVRLQYGLPTDKPIFFYGGNLGKPQGIPFLIECLEANADRKDCHFLVVGDGFDYPRLKSWHEGRKPQSVTLLQHLPKEEYDQLAASCDVGLIFLDYRFTIPNYPSRLLNCLMQKKPIIACTDPNCDTGTIAEENGYGYWCPSNSVEAFIQTVDRMLASDIAQMGKAGYRFLLDNYTVKHTYNAIMQHLS